MSNGFMKMTRKTKVVAGLIACTLAVIVFLLVKDKGRDLLTTDTRSSAFSDDSSKIAFLKKYVKLDSEVEATEFHIQYWDKSGGLLPAPSDWDMQIALKVEPQNLPLWTKGFTPGGQDDLAWGYRLLPVDARWTIRSKPVLYTRGMTVLAVFEPEGIIFKQIRSY